MYNIRNRKLGDMFMIYLFISNYLNILRKFGSLVKLEWKKIAINTLDFRLILIFNLGFWLQLLLRYYFSRGLNNYALVTFMSCVINVFLVSMVYFANAGLNILSFSPI